MAKLIEILGTANSDQILTAYATSTSNTAPALANYTSFGIKALASLSDISDASRVAVAASNTSLEAVNSAIAKLGATNISKEKVQAAFDAYYRILAEADDNASDNADVYADSTNDATNAAAFNDPKLSDYAAIGVTVADAISTTPHNTGTGAGHETLDLLNNAIGRLSATAVNSAANIEALATTANDVMLMAKQGTGSTAAPSQTNNTLITNLNTLLGLNTTTGVNTANITAFKAAIVASADDGSGVKTVAKLIEILGIARLQVFTDDTGALGSKTAATPTITEWTLAGTGLTTNTDLNVATRVALNQATYWKTTNPTNGLNALNSALDTFAGSLVDQTTLQKMVDAYGRILQAADGSRTIDTDVRYVDSALGTGRGRYLTQTDLELVGVNKGGTDNGTIAGTDTGLNYQRTGELLASVIGNLSSSAVDTVAELNTLTGYAETVMKQAADTTTVNTTDGYWIAAVNGLLGTTTSTGANTNNISAIKTKIDAADATTVDSYDELQALVSLVRLNDYASASSGYTTPTLGDFQAVSLSGGQTSAYTTLKSDYLSAYNSATFVQTGMADATSAGNMVAKYTALLNSADGSAGNAATLSATDFNSILGQSSVTSISTVTADTFAGALNNIIDSLGYNSLDSTAELENLGAIMGKVFTMAANTKASGSALVPADYVGLSRTDLGLLGLKVENTLPSNTNLTDAEFTSFNNLVIYSADNGTGVNTLYLLQTLLNNAVSLV